jgi:hypothetical protein
MSQYSTAQITDAVRYHCKKWCNKHYIAEYSNDELMQVLIKRARQIKTSVDDLMKVTHVWKDDVFFER